MHGIRAAACWRWAAASAPSRLDADAFIPGSAPFLLRGGPTVRSEVATVFELGYRGQPLPGLSYSATVFHNRYDRLRTQEFHFDPLFVTFENRMEGRANGMEMWGSYQLRPNWRVSAGWMALHQRFSLKDGSNDAPAPGSAGKDPAHALQLRSAFSLSADKEFDIGVRKVAALSNPAVPAYTALDARFGWKLRPNPELSLTGQNLNGSHGEYGPVATRTEVGRSVAVKLVWQD